MICLQGLVPELPMGTIISLLTTSPVPPVFPPVGLPPNIHQLLLEFAAVFDKPSGLPPPRALDHDIPLISGASPVSVRPYRYPPAIKDEIERQVQEMLTTGIIQPSASPFSSAVLLVKKKDKSWRFCVDFRHLNAITAKTKFPVPVIDELLDELSGASWFSSLDLTAGYHQIRLKEDATHKTAFQTHSGHYEFKVMAFGLSGAPATFQLAMNTTLSPVLRKCVLVFFDDILVYSKTYDDHCHHLRLVLQLLQKDKWQVKISKCSFAQRQLAYLGHIISGKGVSTDPDKIAAVRAWPVPATVKELRSFLGLSGYYRKFVPHYGVICKPLNDLLRKGELFVWTQHHDQAFQALKQALCAAPVLALPDFRRPFVVETDASATGIGVVLIQNGHPLAYLSKALGPRSQGLSTYEKEYLAILAAVDHWKHYLQHAEFHILTDHQSLAQLNEQRLHTVWQQKVFTRLLGLNYKIIYKKGCDNKAADALSRVQMSRPVCAAISSVSPRWLDAVVKTYEADSQVQSILAKLAVDPEAVPLFSI